VTEPDSTPASDVAIALIAQLEAEAAFVDAGGFTLDAHKAREKLAAYQLADPARLVLLLVEAAHLLPNCTDITFTIASGSTKVVFQGVEFTRDELRGCFDPMFIDVAGLDSEHARAMRGRRCLALALNTALGPSDSHVEMTSMRAGRSSVHAVFDSDDRVQTHEQPGTCLASALVVEIRSRHLGDTQQELLRRDARYATMPVHVNATRIDRVRPSADLLAPVSVRDAAGQVVGRLGWCAVQARRKSGAVAFVANGVVVETVQGQELPVGVLALVDADDLQRDISHAKLQRDKAFWQRAKAVVASCKALSQPAPTLDPRPPPPPGRTLASFDGFVGACGWGLGIIIVLLASVWVIEFMPAAGILALGLAIVLLGIWRIARNRRRDNVRMHGHSGLGTIKSVSPAFGLRQRRPVGINMWIERPGQDGYNATFETFMGSGFEFVHPDERMYVRIDPNDPSFVVPDADV
jgi:hypothetical protein